MWTFFVIEFCEMEPFAREVYIQKPELIKRKKEFIISLVIIVRDKSVAQTIPSLKLSHD
jgi:hypothetical protein